MRIKVRLHPILQKLVGGYEVVEVKGHTTGECLRDLESRFPIIKQIIRDNRGQLRHYCEILVNSKSTYPEELRLIRQSHPDMPLLIPGIGAQGGDLASAVSYGVDAQGQKAVINSSRQIIYASRGKDFAQAAREVARSLRDQINACLPGRS